MSTARQTAYSSHPKETPATVADVIAVQKALALLLAEETVLMDRMQVAEVGDLQDRKLKLTGLLERCMRYLKQHREVMEQATAEERAELKRTSEAFHVVLRKNYDTLLVARAVNRAVVRCVTETMGNKDNNPIYNAYGTTRKGGYRPMSMTLNQTI